MKKKLKIHNLNKKKRINFILFGSFCFVFLLAMFRLVTISGATFPTIPSLTQVGNAVGVSVSIEPNTYNTLNEQLKNKEKTLLERESTLKESENTILARTEKQDKILQYLLILSGVLFFLMSLNFVLDWRRGQSMRYSNNI